MRSSSDAPASAVVRPVYDDWEPANHRKIDAAQQLGPLGDAVDDLESCIAELVARTNELQFG